MIEFYKKRGETPLQALERLRVEEPELKSKTLSYAGRLDPMAEGILLILVGEEENKNRKEFLNKDKEYYAEFVLGVSTDTGDILGLVQHVLYKKIDEDILKETVQNFTQITSQTYPWYSSKTVNGKALFEYAREGKFDIERPQRDIKIYSVQDIKIKEERIEKLIVQYVEDIQSVAGDFRQEEIVGEWEKLCHLRTQFRHPREDGDPGIESLDSRLRGNDVFLQHGISQIISCTLTVSSGTYIRALCESFEEKVGVPVVLQKLVRTKVF